MSANAQALVVANALVVVTGLGILPVLGLARSMPQLLARLPLAYAIGVAACGIAVAELAVIGIPVGTVGLPLLAAIALGLGLRTLRRSPTGHAWALPEISIRRLPQLLILTLIGAVIVRATPLFSAKPLVENDGWALWGMRARALYEFGQPVAPVFTEPQYPGLQYPLLLPGLEALDSRFMQEFDGTAIHLQLLGFAIAFVGAAWGLLAKGPNSPLLAGATILAILTAPAFFGQLATNSADIPLAIFAGLGVSAMALWINHDDDGLLPVATLFLAAAALTKNDGEMFVLAAFVSALIAVPRERRRRLLGAGVAVVLLLLPWHMWLLIHGVTSTTFSISHLLDPGYLTSHWYRVDSAARQLLGQIGRRTSWSYLSAFVGFGAVSALVIRRSRAAVFGMLWITTSFLGLLCIYWASPLPLRPDLYNSADRTIDALVIGGALLIPSLFAGSMLSRSTRRAETETA